MIEDRNDLKELVSFVAGFAFVGMACIIAYGHIKKLGNAEELDQRGEKVVGQVTEGIEPTRYAKDEKSWRLKVTYTVGGIQYRHWGEVSESVFESYMQGSKLVGGPIDVLYLPEDPAACAIASPGVSRSSGKNSSFIGMGVACVFGLLGVYGICSSAANVRRIFTVSDNTN